ncbi:hypothetical protein HC026_09230 [Lactobacillus sp. LC28-10]|uniref:Uncharacterized protein n=1 Tax=Secundilactobacillus angelensis TaxID=2722706 RepID=A0ABX1KYS0_9LACO|nr:hypothetical protein [Secundilactobacillus angelensis]MCH5462754.1 hypothetical protein [Secundilactobacillus angelensis]NLR19092.1 hypothetical protein [Secundilactobacillus angelensis]
MRKKEADQMFDHKNEQTVSEMIAGIKNQQQRLQLTNRAVLDFMGIPTTKEADFFTGKFSRTDYDQTLHTLTVIEESLAQLSVPLTAYLAQLRALPLHNIFLRNRYAFWFANFIEAGGSAEWLIRDAKENGFEVIEQIIWSANLLVSTAGVAHIQTHQKQLVVLSDEEYQTISVIMNQFSTASPLFFHNLRQLQTHGLITESSAFKPYWNQFAKLQVLNN